MDPCAAQLSGAAIGPYLRAGPGMVVMAALLLASSALAQAEEPDDWFGHDKALHFGVSAGLAAAGYGGAGLFFQGTAARLVTGAGFALTLGIAKELSDQAGGGSPSWRDLTWDVIGTGTGLLAAWLFDAWVVQPWLGRGVKAVPPRPMGLMFTTRF